MDITIRVTVRRIAGPDATPTEVQAQLIEEISSMSPFAVDHRAEDETTGLADYAIATVRPAEES
jgi:hypothetical protein